MAIKTIEIDVKVDTKTAVHGVDNLTDSTEKLAESTDEVTESTSGLSEGMGVLGGSFGAIVSGAKSAGKALLALALNPIGAVIAALAVGLLAVKTAFESSEAGQNKYAKLMGVIGAITGNFMDLLADLGEAIIGAFENPKEALESFAKSLKENIINRFEGMIELIPQLGKAVKALFNGDFAEAGEIAVNAVAKVTLGVEDLTTKIEGATQATKDFIKEQEREGKLAAKVADDRARADKIERDLVVRRSKLESDIAELRLKSRQEDKFTSEERKAALIEAQGLENELLDRATEVLELRRDAQILENTFSRSNKENLDKEANAIAAVNNQVAARANVARQLQRELNTIQGQIDAENKAITTKEEKADAKKLEVANKEAELLKASGLKAIEIELELKALRAELGLNDPDATAEQLQASFDAKAEVEETNFQSDLVKNEERFLAGLIVEDERNIQAELLAAKHQEALTKIAIAGEDAIQRKRNAGINSWSNGLNNVSSLTSDVFAITNNLGDQDTKAKEKRAKQQFEIQKALNLSMAGVDAFKAITASLAQSPVAIGPIPNPAGIASLAFAAATSALNIGKIASSKYKSSGGGAAVSTPVVGTLAVPNDNDPASTPALNTETLFSTQNLDPAESESVGSGAGQNQIRAVVVESDITNSQNTINEIEARSEIGG